MKNAKQLVILALLLSGFFSALVLFRQLSAERFLRGADAYYYALQANYWAKTGKVKIPDSSPVHRLTGTLQVWGLSSENAVRSYEIASLFLFFLTALGLATRLGKAISLLGALLLL